MPDLLNDFCPVGARNGLNHGFAVFPLFRTDLDFDELVVEKGPGDFLVDGLSQPLAAGEDHGLEVVGGLFEHFSVSL